MNKIVKITIFAIFVLSTLTSCTITTDRQVPLSTLNVNGTGKVYLTPDLAYISIGVQNKSAEVSAALAQNNQASQAIASSLKDLGVEAKDIQTTAFNIYPEQQIDPQTGQLTGTLYVVDNSVMVTVRDLQNLGTLLDTMVKSGANTINGIQFDIADKTTPLTEARRLAIEDAQVQATQLASAAGIKLGKITGLNVYYNGTPAMVTSEGKGMPGFGTGNQVPVAAGQMMIQMDANISYEIQ
jgi:uncharacterized protein